MIKVTRPLHFTRLSDNTFSFYVVNVKRHLKGKKAQKSSIIWSVKNKYKNRMKWPIHMASDDEIDIPNVMELG